MKVATKHFGTVDVDDLKVIRFDEGIFGFSEMKEFVLLYEGEEEKSPFAWLQALNDPLVCLPLINPLVWFPEYAPEIDDDQIEKIGELRPEDLDIYTVVVVPENIKEMTTNLRAPILINRLTKKGIQVIVNDEEYAIKHNLYNQLEALKKAGE